MLPRLVASRTNLAIGANSELPLDMIPRVARMPLRVFSGAANIVAATWVTSNETFSNVKISPGRGQLLREMWAIAVVYPINPRVSEVAEEGTRK